MIRNNVQPDISSLVLVPLCRALCVTAQQSWWFPCIPSISFHIFSGSLEVGPVCSGFLHWNLDLRSGAVGEAGWTVLMICFGLYLQTWWKELLGVQRGSRWAVLSVYLLWHHLCLCLSGSIEGRWCKGSRYSYFSYCFFAIPQTSPHLS